MHMWACGPGSPELSKSNMDMASKLFTFTFTYVNCLYLCCHDVSSMHVCDGFATYA